MATSSARWSLSPTDSSAIISIYLFIHLSIYTYLSIHPSIHLFIYPSIHITCIDSEANDDVFPQVVAVSHRLLGDARHDDDAGEDEEKRVDQVAHHAPEGVQEVAHVWVDPNLI